MLIKRTQRIIGLAAAVMVSISACGDAGDDAYAPTTAHSNTYAPIVTSTPETTAAPDGNGERSRNRRNTTKYEGATTTTAMSGFGGNDRSVPADEVPYDGTTFEDTGVNPAVTTDRDRFSTFALDVDTGSYTIGRRFIRDGFVPASDSVRVEEYVNYFDMGYPVPTESAFALHIDGGPTPFVKGPTWRTLRIGVQGQDLSNAERQPANLTFVIDVSGSMDREDRLESVKDALAILVKRLDARDQVAIVTYSNSAQVVLEPTVATEADTILDAIRRLRPQNSTNVEDGLRKGYRLAREAFTQGAINRVVLASDGVANVGNTTAEQILDTARKGREDGIQLVSLGFGMGNFNDVLLERLADDGDGFYAYVDTKDEAKRLFTENLVGTLQSIATEAKIQVEFNPATVARYRLVGYENRDVADHDFRNDRVDGGEIGSGHSVTAVYEVKLHDSSTRQALATATLRWLDPDDRQPHEISREVFGDELAERFEDTVPGFRLATTVAAYAETLRDSAWSEHYSFHDVVAAADALRFTAFGDDADVVEFISLVNQVGRFVD